MKIAAVIIFVLIFLVIAMYALILLSVRSKKVFITVSGIAVALAVALSVFVINNYEETEIHDFEISVMLNTNGSNDQRMLFNVVLPDGTEEKFRDSIALKTNVEKDTVVKRTFFGKDSYELQLSRATYNKLYDLIYPKSVAIQSNT